MRIIASLVMASALAGALALSACGDEAAQGDAAAVAQGGKAAGEVLGGTISDDMLPLDSLTSQSPPAILSPEEGGSVEGDPAETGAQDGADGEDVPPGEDSASEDEGAEDTAR